MKTILRTLLEDLTDFTKIAAFATIGVMIMVAVASVPAFAVYAFTHSESATLVLELFGIMFVFLFVIYEIDKHL